MIPPPPPDAKPSLEQAVMWPFFISFGLTLGSVIRAWASGTAVDWDGAIAGQFVVTAILSLPLMMAVAIAVLSGGGTRPLPFGPSVWGQTSTLFYRTTRAMLFLCGFVLFYHAISVALFREPLAPWSVGALVPAAMALVWFGLLRIGPWRAPASSGGR
jgi:hypothetical protein